MHKRLSPEKRHNVGCPSSPDQAASNVRQGPPVGRSCFVAGWIGTTNVGDELIFQALQQKLGAAGVTEIICPSPNPKRTMVEHGVLAVKHTNILQNVRVIRKADALILGGGGLIQDETSPFNLPYHLSRPYLARLLDKPYAAIGISAGHVQRPLSTEMIRRAFTAARSVVVRDDDSARRLQQIGVKGVKTGCDLVFSLEPPEYDYKPDEIVVCLRPILRGAGFRPVSLRGEPIYEDVVTAFARALDATARRFLLPIRFVAFEGDRDHELHQRVAARMRTSSVRVVASVSNVFDQVARGRVVVSMRFHGGVVASRMGRPVVLIDYSPKVAALGRELGDGAVTLRNDPDDFQRIPDAIETVMDREQELRQAVAAIRARDVVNDAAIRELIGSV